MSKEEKWTDRLQQSRTTHNKNYVLHVDGAGFWFFAKDVEGLNKAIFEHRLYPESIVREIDLNSKIDPVSVTKIDIRNGISLDCFYHREASGPSSVSVKPWDWLRYVDENGDPRRTNFNEFAKTIAKETNVLSKL